MKKGYVFLIILIAITCIIIISSNTPLRQALRYGKSISKKIQILYNEKSKELSENADKLIKWREEISNTSCTIERKEDANWQYYTENYEWIPFQWEDKSIEEIMNMLFEQYDVKRIVLNDDSIEYFISEDALIYSIDSVERKAYTEHLEGYWYHFKFPYGI